MAVDWVLNLPCLPKETLGDGNFLAGTDAMLACIKSGNRAAVIAEIARQNGESPESQSIVVRVEHADGVVKEQDVSYNELVDHARQLDPHAAACKGCPANVLGHSFGCIGAINYPIPQVVENWLLQRLQLSSLIGGQLFLAAIRDFGYTGEPIQQFREAALFEAGQPLRKKLKAGLFSSESVTTNQLYQALFCIGEPLDPGHCFGVLLWLGCLSLDGKVIASAEQAAAASKLAGPEERQQRTSLVTGADRDVNGIDSMDEFLHALYRSWLLDVPVWVNA